MDQFTEALQKSKAVNRMVDSFVNKDIVAQDSLQLDELEKGKAGQIGEIRTWGGKKYQKTPKGWRPVKAGAQSSQKEASKKEKNHLSVTKAWISKYEEKISAEIKKLQERLETAKKQAETTAKVEAAIPDVFKKAGLNFKSATLILNEDNPERQYFNVEAGIPERFMVKGAHGSNSANARAYENALAKAAILSSMVESFFEEKGLTVKASINPYSLQYKDSSEKNNSTAEIDLKISNYGK